ncbi:uncharacterized protein HMPREF1541_09783 [Cyphellophora europaea CBS 101466]|uniref:Nucleotide-diphospho-sugar transferase domain-containing protein n=1 Tax=Cyphellophora europaea (strain CBS 101466) TaxID=1220924 RepID=W2SA73_CYPE1|nr:uncharacterized protein HMPREF1541_09783 [Cyphellophora europaea CBS 101466]ETN44908.1 hypothetical protein HMPREF1541_09783 [Cyphellophora europaea CBS 101466]
MAWSTTRTINKGVGRHYLRFTVLVVLAWFLIYHVQFKHDPDSQSSSSLFDPADRQWLLSSRVQPKPDSPQINIAAAGPQIGQATTDISIDGSKVVESLSSDSPLPIADLATAGQLPPAAPTPSSPDSPATSVKWVKTRYTAPDEPISHLVLSRPHPTQQPSLLVLVMTKDGHSWGRNDGPSRNFSSFLTLLHDTGLDLSTVAIGLLTSDETEFASYESGLDEDIEGFAAATLVLHPGYQGGRRAVGSKPKAKLSDGGGEGNAEGEGGAAEDDERGHRHDNDIQHARRVEMARLRNYLMFTALPLAPTAANLLWIDADVYALSDNLLKDMQRHMEDERVGVLTVISRMGGGEGGDYDFNAWRGERSSPNTEQREKLREALGSWVAGSVDKKSEHMGDIIGRLDREERQRKIDSGELVVQEDDKDEKGVFDPAKASFEDSDPKEEENKREPEVLEIEGIFRLDAVGATVLMVKAALVRQGLAFATTYLVGTDWQSEGWDGVESEGLCVAARGLGGECWGMRNGFSRHSTG